MTNAEHGNAILKMPGAGEERPSWRRRVLLGFVLVTAALACWMIVREILIEKAAGRVRSVVSELGGRMGSIHFRPFGSEYIIFFQDREFTEEELSRFYEINELADWSTVYVGIQFQDTNLTKEDIHKVREQCPGCGMSRIVDGEFFFDK